MVVPGSEGGILQIRMQTLRSPADGATKTIYGDNWYFLLAFTLGVVDNFSTTGRGVCKGLDGAQAKALAIRKSERRRAGEPLLGYNLGVGGGKGGCDGVAQPGDSRPWLNSATTGRNLHVLFTNSFHFWYTPRPGYAANLLEIMPGSMAIPLATKLLGSKVCVVDASTLRE